MANTVAPARKRRVSCRQPRRRSSVSSLEAAFTKSLNLNDEKDSALYDFRDSNEEDGYESEDESNCLPAGSEVDEPVPRYKLGLFPPDERPKALVLFAGAGFSSMGLSLAGYHVTAVEMDPRKAYLHDLLKGHADQVIVANVLDLSLDFLRSFPVIWASPPCKQRTVMRVATNKTGAADEFGEDLVNWCLHTLSHCQVLWVENVYNTNTTAEEGAWGKVFNAAQFTPLGLHCRTRIIGGKFPLPRVFRSNHLSYRRIRGIRFEPIFKRGDYKPTLDKRPESARYNCKLEYKAVVTHSKREGATLRLPPESCGLCPSLTASEWKTPMINHRVDDAYSTYRAYGSRFYNCERIRLDPAAMHLGFPDGIPDEWRIVPTEREWPEAKDTASWHQELYSAIGNAAPVYMCFNLAQAALYATQPESMRKYMQLDSRFVPNHKLFPVEWVDTIGKQTIQYS